jgi:hypothetical protein
VVCLDPDIPGRVYVYLEGDDLASAAEQFTRYGVLPKDNFPGDGRLAAVTFELDLPAMLENMLDLGFSIPSGTSGSGSSCFNIARSGSRRNWLNARVTKGRKADEGNTDRGDISKQGR